MFAMVGVINMLLIYVAKRYFIAPAYCVQIDFFLYLYCDPDLVRSYYTFVAMDNATAHYATSVFTHVYQEL